MFGFNDSGLVPYGHRGSLWNGFFDEPFFSTLMSGEMKADVKESDTAYTVAVDIPGVDKKDIAVDYTDSGTLTVAYARSEEKKENKDGWLRHERSVGRCSRAFYLPGVQREGIAAQYENGVLTVTLPKGGQESRPNIQIQ